MKFLLIGFVAVVAIIGISIIALAYFSARSKGERKKDKVSQAPATKKKLWPVIAVILLVLLIGWGVSGRKFSGKNLSFPVHSEAKDIQIGIGETARIKVYPNAWVGCFKVPPKAEVRVKSPGEIEYLFWESGRRIICKKNSSPVYFGNKDEFREFWLRGDEGEIIITVSPQE
jgi:heme/copper-type cytochrome/quinol oxidase subunit 2